LLRAIGMDAFPTVLGTRDHGRIQQANPDPYLLNNTVVYVQVNKSQYYLLDASNSANLYNTIPFNDLSANGLSIDITHSSYRFIHLQDTSRVIQSVFLNAEIPPSGKMTGNAEITSSSYNKIKAVEKYNADGEKKYIDSLHISDNNTSITSFKMENMDIDTLPLTQKIGFTSTLSGSDENYIYFNLNSFTYLENNPFTADNRYSDIDMGFRNDYSINGIYKIPAGYKVDALPKSKILVMPDRSIIFRRTLAQGDGIITVRCIIEHGKNLYPEGEYPYLQTFYKEMYELLNEPIVLKKL
jgi:hypothetical protein